MGTAEKLPHRSFVKFNSNAVVLDGDGVQRPRFRTAAAERAERAEARAAKKKGPLQALSGPEKKGPSVGPRAKKEKRDFQTELLDGDGMPIWSKARLLADEWRAEVAIFDERKKRGEPYDVDWGGNARAARIDFNAVTGYGYGLLNGGELMRHFVKCLDDDIKKNA